ncbi:GNAT family N-acetyltransferase [Nocardioides sp. TRM66260-LWL]|uniref:GNAT family N-acetyltransferase n=1 Tax=Nocardioides sp. TRM66260-LWL TaxID=2874478 RepID=UPI001CC3C02D|nr:GNAT family N-acetyltransferase [Nocardioides sp. TRM66260-LWL]MBZ5732978.1 GNAT family N-acetyltransferase [Nocardioides sp. TRM66260-LWL]
MDDELQRRVLAASAAWRSPWFPPDARHLRDDRLEAYAKDGLLTVMHVGLPGRGGTPSAASDLALVQDLARRAGCSEVSWTSGAGVSAAGLEELLAARGGTVTATIEILARRTDVTAPAPESSRIVVAEVATAEQYRDVLRVDAEVWDHAMPDESELRAGFPAGADGRWLATLDGEPAGAGGYGIVDDVARLWGAGVVPRHRRQGVYAALVECRVESARERGASLALVHALPTSAPILRRLGFERFGERLVWRFAAG